VVAVVLWGVAFGSLPTLLQAAARRAAPDAGDAAPGLTNAMFNVGIAGGGLLGARLLLVAAPSTLALTGAALAAAALVLVLVPAVAALTSVRREHVQADRALANRSEVDSRRRCPGSTWATRPRPRCSRPACHRARPGRSGPSPVPHGPQEHRSGVCAAACPWCDSASWQPGCEHD
jgi:hypothetical protein